MRRRASNARRAGAPGRESDHPDREVGRGERIRTSGPLLPKQVLYQAELHPVVIDLMVSMRGKMGKVEQGVFER